VLQGEAYVRAGDDVVGCGGGPGSWRLRSAGLPVCGNQIRGRMQHRSPADAVASRDGTTPGGPRGCQGHCVFIACVAWRL
jgi:hypothetical protein